MSIMNARHQCRFQIEALERREVPSALAGGHVAIDSSPPVKVHFQKINARGEGQITGFDKVTGQVSTSGRINSGLLRGTTRFSAQIIDARGDYVGTTTVVTRHHTKKLALVNWKEVFSRQVH